MKRILIVASEAVPFIKTGGLADVIGSLPKYFDKSKYDVRVILPKYVCISDELINKCKNKANCTVSLNWRHQYAGVLEGKVDSIIYYLIDNDFYFSGTTPYGEIHNDGEKFAFFSKAVLTVLPLINFKPDVIHCNDWQTSWIPVFLKEQFNKSFYKNIKTIFTIHNMRFQGQWDIGAYRDITGLPDSCFTYDKLECYGSGNPFKGGIAYADYITTVSESYAEEIQTSEYGEGLEKLMQYRKDDLFGIVNGLDTEIFDPSKDELIVENFDVASWKNGKKKNKLVLQKELGLTQSEDVFLIGMVSRLTDQKGFDLVADKLDKIMENPDIQVVLQGTGEERYQQIFLDLAEKYPDRMCVKIQYSETLAHRIYASSDAFLMPSMFEPCGLSQLISLRYGTVPMVRATGGLKDTVMPYDAKTHQGNGFRFDEYDSDAMLEMVLDAYKLFIEDKEAWAEVVTFGISKDYSWKNSAAEYANLYDSLLT